MKTLALPARIHSTMIARQAANPAQLAEQARRVAQARMQDGQVFLASLVRQHVQQLDELKGRTLNLVA